MTTEKCDDGATAVSSLTEVDWTSSAECRDKVIFINRYY